MSARQAAGTTELAKLVRERQDLVKDWLSLDEARIKALSKSSTQRDREFEFQIRKELELIDRNIDQLDLILKKTVSRIYCF